VALGTVLGWKLQGRIVGGSGVECISMSSGQAQGGQNSSPVEVLNLADSL